MFLSLVDNKTSFITFLVSEWKNRVLFAPVIKTCYKISSASEGVALLECTEEVAGGRILLHATHAAQEGYPPIIICSEDTCTNNSILCLGFYETINVRLLQMLACRI